MGQWKEDSGLSTLGHYRMFSSVDSMRGGVFIADFRTDVRRASNRLVSQRPLEPALGGVVNGGGDALPDEGEDSAMEAGLEAEVHAEPPADQAMDFHQVFASGKRCRRLLQE